MSFGVLSCSCDKPRANKRLIPSSHEAILILTVFLIIDNNTMIYKIKIHSSFKSFIAVVVVCHDQFRLQVSQGFRCQDS